MIYKIRTLPTISVTSDNVYAQLDISILVVLAERVYMVAFTHMCVILINYCQNKSK